MTTKTTQPSFLRYGDSHFQQQADATPFVKIKDGQSVAFAPIDNWDSDQTLTIFQHTIWRGSIANSPIFPCIRFGDEVCPGCEVGHTASPRVFVGVVVPEEGAKVLAVNVKTAEQLRALNEAYEGYKGQIYNIARRGSGFSTSYTVTPANRKYDVSKVERIDLSTKIGPLTRQAILDQMRERNYDFDANRKSAQTTEGGTPATADDWDSVVAG